MQVARDVRRARVEHGARERVQRFAVDVVDDAEVPARRSDAQHLRTHANRDVGVRRDVAERIVARRIRRRARRDGAVLQQLDGDAARGRATVCGVDRARAPATTGTRSNVTWPLTVTAAGTGPGSALLLPPPQPASRRSTKRERPTDPSNAILTAPRARNSVCVSRRRDATPRPRQDAPLHDETGP